MVLTPPIALWVIPVERPGRRGAPRPRRRPHRDSRAGGWSSSRRPATCRASCAAVGARCSSGPSDPTTACAASAATLRHAVRTLRPAVVHTHLAYADIVAALVGARSDASSRPSTASPATTSSTTTRRPRSRVMDTVHTARLRRFDAAIAVSRATADAMTGEVAPRPTGHRDPQRRRPRRPHPPRGRACASSRSPASRPRSASPRSSTASPRCMRDHPDGDPHPGRHAGEGETALRAQVERLGLAESVSLPGLRRRRRRRWPSHDVLAMLSVWENCSYALLDAAARGMGVVASRVGGNPEILPATVPGRRRRRRRRRRRAGAARARRRRTPGPRPTGRRVADMCAAHRRGLRLRAEVADEARRLPVGPARRTGVERAAAVDREVRITDFAADRPDAAAHRSTLAGFPLNELAMAALVGLCLFRPARGRSPAADSSRASCVGALLALLALLRYRQRGRLDAARRPRRRSGAGSIWACGTGRFSLRSAALGLATGLHRRDRPRRGRDRRRLLPRAPHRLPGRPQRRRLLHRRPRRPGRSFFCGRPVGRCVWRSPSRSWPGWSCPTRAPACWPVPSPSSGCSSGRRLGAIGRRRPGRRAGLAGRQHPREPDELFGPFSNRSGSDALRERIIAAGAACAGRHALVRPRSRHGEGQPARPRVLLPQQLSRHPPGGRLARLWSWCSSCSRYAFFRLSPWPARRPRRRRARRPRSSASPVMAVTLGEVLLDTPMAIAVGFALGPGARSTRLEPGRPVSDG